MKQRQYKKHHGTILDLEKQIKDLKKNDGDEWFISALEILLFSLKLENDAEVEATRPKYLEL